jgi:phosphoribosylanthranilate isomerase
VYRVHVKICGITNIVDAQMAEREGADALGFVFWPQSPRAVAAQRVAEIIKVLSPMTAKIGVFRDAGTSEAEKAVRRIGLTGAQICGEPPGSSWHNLARRIRLMRVIPIGDDDVPEEPPWNFCYDYIFDPATENLPGEDSEPFDWTRLPDNEGEAWGRIYISGGLTSENVGELIATHRPYGINVSSAVEGGSGRKEPALVREFMAAVREAEYKVNRDLRKAK